MKKFLAIFLLITIATCLFIGTMYSLQAETMESSLNENTPFLSVEDMLNNPIILNAEPGIVTLGYNCGNHTWGSPIQMSPTSGTHAFNCINTPCTAILIEDHIIDYRTYCHQPDVCEICLLEVNPPVEHNDDETACGECRRWSNTEHYTFCGKTFGGNSCKAKFKFEPHNWEDYTDPPTCIDCGFEYGTFEIIPPEEVM